MPITLPKIAKSLINFKSFNNVIKTDKTIKTKNRKKEEKPLEFDGSFDNNNSGRIKSTNFIKTFFCFADPSLPNNKYGLLLLNGNNDYHESPNHDEISAILNSYADEISFYKEVNYIEKLIKLNIYYSIGKTKQEALDPTYYLDPTSSADYNARMNLLANHLKSDFKDELEAKGIRAESITGRNVDGFVVFLIGTALSEWNITFNNRHQKTINSQQKAIKNNLSIFAKKQGFVGQAVSLKPYFEFLIDACLHIQSKRTNIPIDPFARKNLNISAFFDALIPQRFENEWPIKPNSSSPVRLYITSNSGSGKSTLVNSVCLLACARKLNLELTEAMKKNNRSIFGDESGADFIPILVLASKANKEILNDYQLEDLFYINDALSNCLSESLNDNRILILIDGFDEVKQEKQGTFLKKISEFISQHQQANIVITSRFVGEQPILESPNFTNNHIEKFGNEDISTLASKALGRDDFDKFIQKFTNNQYIKNFISNPFKLVTALDFFEKNDADEFTLTNLIQHFIEIHYNNRINELEKLIPCDSKMLYYRFLQNVAFDFVSNKKKDANPNDLRILLSQVMPELFQIQSNPETVSLNNTTETSPLDVGGELDQALIRVQENESQREITDYNSYIIKSISVISGILFVNNHNRFEFQDKIVKNYLAAKYITENINERIEKSTRIMAHNPVHGAYAIGLIAEFISEQEAQFQVQEINFSEDFLTSLALVVSCKDANYLVQSGMVNILWLLYKKSDNSNQKKQLKDQLNNIINKRYGNCSYMLNEELKEIDERINNE